MKEDIGINIMFGDYGNTMTVSCFDEDSEMSIVIRSEKSKAVYSMNIWEVKQLKKWLNEHLKNESDANKILSPLLKNKK